LIITQPKLDALRVTWKTEFQRGLTAAAPQWTNIATLVKSTGKSNQYGWLGQFPHLREWVGSRQHKSMAEKQYSIENKPFEGSVEVLEDDIEDDNLGQYSQLFVEMGDAVATHPDELCYGLLKNGNTTQCYDGQYFFDTDHPVNSEVDGSGTDTSVSNIITDAGYTGPAWYIVDKSKRVMPVIYQERRAPRFTSMDTPTTSKVYEERVYQYGVDKRCNVGFGFWQTCIRMEVDPSKDALDEGLARMRSFKADGGRPLGLGYRNLELCVPGTQGPKFKPWIQNKQISDGTTTIDNPHMAHSP
jgi:phage major head subunit gpT-like protein